MIFPLASDVLIFCATCLGLGFVFATFLRTFPALDRLSLGIGAAVICLYLICFARYLLHLPPAGLWLPVLAGLALLLVRHHAVRELWRDQTTRRVCGYWLILAAWCLGWQALVFSYSGGGWSGDWQEHYDRAHFFLQHWPTNHLFIDMYPEPARPPLANLVIGGLLGLAGGKFFHFQVFSTLLATLVFFPLAGLVHRLRPTPPSQAFLLGLLMLSPIFVQNATFPWTKLPAAYFIVLAADLLTRRSAPLPPSSLAFVPLALAAALLTHYSAAIWIVALGLTWLVANRACCSSLVHRRNLVGGVVAGALLFMTWLGWSLDLYGAKVTFTANTSSGLAPSMPAMERAGSLIGNTYRTLVPAWLWEGMPPLLQQESGMARLRDRWFCLYQLNLPFAFGFGGVVVLGRLLLDRTSDGASLHFWGLLVPLVIMINAAVNPVPDSLGLTHIALQPLVLLGLGWIATNVHTLPPAWRRLWVGGLVCDFSFGIALQFGVQSLWLDRWLEPGRTVQDYIVQLSQPAAANYYGKLRMGAEFLEARLPPLGALFLLGTSAALALAALRSSAKSRSL